MTSDANEDWRNDVVRQLRHRNQTQAEPFEGLMLAHAKAFEATAKLQQEKSQLMLQNEKLRQDAGVGGAAGGEYSSAEVQELKSKIFKLQEELTGLHRRKGENAQQVIDLTASVKEKEALLSEQAAQNISLQQQIEQLKRQLEMTKRDSHELRATTQLLKDEYQTLQLALTSAEKKLLNAQKDNDRLVAQVIELKEKDVARLNKENEDFMKVKHEELKQQLEEAARENKTVVTIKKNQSPQAVVGSDNLDSLICHSVRIPTRAYLKFEAHDSEVNAIKWSPHGLVVATAGGDRKIKIWDVSKGVTAECRGQFAGSNGAVLSLDFDAAGALLLASSADFAARVWSVEDKRLRHTLTGHSAKVFAAKFMGENTKVCSGSHDRTLKVWDLKSRACVNTLYPGSSVNDLVCMDQVVISGHFDKKLRFYDVRVGTQPTNELILSGKVTSVDISRCGKQYLLACTRDDALNLMDFRCLDRPVNVFKAEEFRVGCDWTRAVLSPDSAYISVGGYDGRTFIWNVDRPESLETTLRDDTDSTVVAVAWQPAGNSMVTCDKNKRVVVWADI